jgi:hypothetical protein
LAVQMPQIFRSRANVLSRVVIFGGVFIVAAVGWLVYSLQYSDFVTNAFVFRDQPISFSHERHVAGNGIDCRYCHTSVETSAFAGMPPTKTCMNCHRQIFADSPFLELVRSSVRDNRPIRWTRVHDLPDFVYFDHGIHVNKGIGCSTCHGRVDRMPLTFLVNPLYMEWCLGCHRNPERYVRPREAVFRMDYEPPPDQVALGRKLVSEYRIQSLTDCYICHR